MKHTLILSLVESAAFTGVMGEVARKREELRKAAEEAEKVIADIVAFYGAPKVAVGGNVSTGEVEGKKAMIYDAMADAPATANEAAPVDVPAPDAPTTVNRVAEILPMRATEG